MLLKKVIAKNYEASSKPCFLEMLSQTPRNLREIADQKFDLLKRNPYHPSLHLKKVGKYWSVRATLKHRALAVEVENHLIWFWIGTHAEYDELIP